VLEALHHRAKFGGARISPAAGTAKNVELFVSLSVRHAHPNAAGGVRQVAPIVRRAFLQRAALQALY